MTVLVILVPDVAYLNLSLSGYLSATLSIWKTPYCLVCHELSLVTIFLTLTTTRFEKGRTSRKVNKTNRSLGNLCDMVLAMRRQASQQTELWEHKAYVSGLIQHSIKRTPNVATNTIRVIPVNIPNQTQYLAT